MPPIITALRRLAAAVEDFETMVIAPDFGDILATDATTGAQANKSVRA